MNNLIKMERFHLFHNRTYWLSAFAVFLLGFVTADTYLSELFGPKGDTAHSLTDILNGMVYDSTFLLVIISCILALILGQEFSFRTIHQDISAGHSRLSVFLSKTAVYLTAFNLLALIYPAAGCIREIPRFGLPDAGTFFYAFAKAAFHSFLLNSCILLIPILCCFVLQNMAKALSAAALITFVSSLYLGYGMMLKLPIRFLPSYQIREVVTNSGIFSIESLAVALLWNTVLLAASWSIFCRCDLT
ncbi:ABC transporter permease [Anaerostipes sp.]|uniref:ABC transporter permease n=1 Tax=Anaerostipes sp. TaxID=1872530 RepID=UPI0025C677C7|nr:ABC transporter permease [Anaerostipes sp.]MBS7008399.1 ABC transporter permease [Anaerostipes sp.]